MNAWELLLELPKIAVVLVFAVTHPKMSNYSVDFLPMKEWGFGEFNHGHYGIDNDGVRVWQQIHTSKKYGFFEVDSK